MNRNDDQHIVVMDRAMFDKLMYAARVGASEQNLDLGPIRRHVRKFNTVIAQEEAYVRQGHELARQQLKEQVCDLLKRKQGQTLYHKTSERMYWPVTLLARAPHSKYALRVEHQRAFAPSKFNCFPTALVEEVDPYWMLVREGPHAGAYVPPDFFR